MPDHNFTPENIGFLTGLAVSGLATVIFLYRKGGTWIKSAFTSLFSLAKMLITLKEGHERNETTLKDHEARIRFVEKHVSEDTITQEQFRQDIDGLKSQGQRLADMSAGLAVMSEQVKAIDQRGERLETQIQMLIEHMLDQPVKRKN